jgi:hypothetical protein
MSSLRRISAFLVPTSTALATLLTFAEDPTFFKWHPVAFIAAFVLLSANAVAAMKWQRWLWVHSALQALASAAICFGFYVIWSLKEQFKRPHFWSTDASLHAWLGGAALSAYLLMSVLASLFMSPLHDKRTRVGYAAMHRQWGFLFWLVACAALLTGWNKNYALASPAWLGFAAALASMTFLNYNAAVWTTWTNLFAVPRFGKSKE